LTDGTVGSPLTPSAEAITALIARTVGTPTPVPRTNGHGSAPTQPVAPPIGVPAPAFTLPDLQGKPVSLADFRGRSTLLFWNPNCGFCQRMLDDLKAWEANPPKGAPQLLVVSTSTVEVNRTQGLRAFIVLDQHFAAGRQFRATGTPMAVLIDTRKARLPRRWVLAAQRY